MRIFSLFLYLLLFSPLCVGNDHPSSPVWLDDFSAACALAKEQQRAVLLNFTGSDWCVWCDSLRDEVFSRPAFVAYAAAALVLVEVDFPKKKSLAPALLKQNRELADRYGVTGYPTIIVLSPEGVVLGELKYMEGGSKTFVRELRRLIAAAKSK